MFSRQGLLGCDTAGLQKNINISEDHATTIFTWRRQLHYMTSQSRRPWLEFLKFIENLVASYYFSHYELNGESAVVFSSIQVA